MALGHCAALAALVIALDESGILPKEVYRDTLHRFWQDMPEDEAIGEAGAVIERVLDLLEAPVGETKQYDNGAAIQDRWQFAEEPVNDVMLARTA